MVWLAAFVAALVIAACSRNESAPVSEPQPQVSESAPQKDAHRQPATQTAPRTEDAEPTAAPGEEEASEEGREDSPQQHAQESESRPTEAASQSSTPENEEEEPAKDLTDVSGVVLADADVRVRPGLAWPMVDRVSAGEPVLVLHAGGGWYRTTYGDGLAGWIRSTAVDLGEIDEWSVLRQAAPPILAVWRGVEYSVMGQSADGAEVRLMAVDDELSEILGAPMDEVTLLADDVTLEDLPILIGDETVVFPGDDFRAGQGRILPKANEWMWLPWGWLLAHNDEYIWQWRPETDELEFIRRPLGLAKFSPDGGYLAIDHLCSPADGECKGGHFAIILPLDGSESVSALAQAHKYGLAAESVWNSGWFLAPDWAPNSQAVEFSVHVPVGEYVVPASIVFHVDGRVAVFDMFGSRVLGDRDCYVERPYPGGYGNPWEIRADNAMTARGGCTDEDGESRLGALVFSLDGEFLGVDDSNWWRGWDYGADLIRSTTDGDVLSEELYTLWSPTEQHAIVIDLVAANAWIYHAAQHELEMVEAEANDIAQTGLSTVLERHQGDVSNLNAYTAWHQAQVGVVIKRGWLVDAVMLVNTRSGVGKQVDIGGRAWVRSANSHGWNPDGTAYHFASSSFDLADGLAIREWNSSHLVVVDRDGEHLGLVNIANTCQFSASEWELRHSAEWSPDGAWFAIGGLEHYGLFACPDWDWSE